MSTRIDWYERRDELRAGQVFTDADGDQLMLTDRVPGYGTRWYAAIYTDGSWSYEDYQIEPGDLIERVQS